MPDSIDLGRYQVFVPPDPFEDHTGPFYFRIEGDARAILSAERTALSGSVINITRDTFENTRAT